MYRYRYQSTELGPTYPSTGLKSSYAQPSLSKRQMLVPPTPLASQRSAPSVDVDEGIDDENSSSDW